MSVQLFPASQRRHWYAKLSGPVPLQVPFATVRVVPSRAAPVIAGNEVFCGGAAVTTAVAAEVAARVPAPFDALTTIRSVDPTSADVSVYEDVAAGMMSMQAAPVELHRRHW